MGHGWKNVTKVDLSLHTSKNIEKFQLNCFLSIFYSIFSIFLYIAYVISQQPWICSPASYIVIQTSWYWFISRQTHLSATSNRFCDILAIFTVRMANQRRHRPYKYTHFVRLRHFSTPLLGQLELELTTMGLIERTIQLQAISNHFCYIWTVSIATVACWKLRST